jgi:PAS domain S-box-containing protein
MEIDQTEEQLLHSVALQNARSIRLARDRTEQELRRVQEALRESEERYRVLFDSVPVAVFVCDCNSVIQQYNRRAVELWGREPTCGVEKHCGSVRLWLSADTLLPHEQSPVVEVLRTGIPALDVEVLIERPDGSRLPVLVNFAALKNAAGEIIGAVTSFIDITERKQTELALADRVAQQKALFQLSARANRARTLQEIYDAALDAILAAFHCERAAVLFRGADGVMRFTAWRGLSDPYRAAVEGHSPWHSDEREPQPITISDVAKASMGEPIRRALDAERIGAVAFVPILEHGHLVGKFMVYCDEPREFKTEELQLCQTIATTLTWAIERKRGEEDLERIVHERTAKLEETVVELEGFSYSITHDLRAPLRALQSFSDILREDYDDKLDEAAKDYLRRIATSANRMDKLIQDVLSYSRVLRMDLRLEQVDVEKLLLGMLESYPDYQKPKAEVVIEGPLATVRANEAALTQCFSNLLNNAVKFVPPGVKPSVQISAERRAEMVRFWVADNGIGIDPKYFENIFGAFHRLSTTFEGTGIGLTIVRKAVERMGGKAGVESQPGRGSRFWIELKPAGTKKENP